MQGFGWDFEFYRTTFMNYWWYGLFFVIYIGGLFYAVHKGSVFMKQVFVVPFMILLITIFNPFVMEPILEMTDWHDRYSRFFWILPVEILSAYMLACLIGKQRRREEKVLLIAFMVCLVFLCGGSATKMELDDNIYKVDNNVIEVADLIEEISGQGDKVVFVEENLYYWIRQYDPSLIMAVQFGELERYRWETKEEIDAEEQYEGEGTALSMFIRGVEIEPETVNAAIESRKVDFFVRNKEFYSEEYLGQLNIVYVDETEAYEIYRCLHD